MIRFTETITFWGVYVQLTSSTIDKKRKKIFEMIMEFLKWYDFFLIAAFKNIRIFDGFKF